MNKNDIKRYQLYNATIVCTENLFALVHLNSFLYLKKKTARAGLQSKDNNNNKVLSQYNNSILSILLTIVVLTQLAVDYISSQYAT